MLRQVVRVVTFTVATVAMTLSGTAPSWTDALTPQARVPTVQLTDTAEATATPND